MNKPPAFQFYPRDWLSDPACRRLDPYTRAAYVDMLCAQWLEGSVDDIPTLLAAYGYDPALTDCGKLAALFPNGKNRRLARTRQDLEDRRKKASKDGKRGADKRWPGSGIDRVPYADPITKDIGFESSASATATAITDNVPTVRAEPDVEKWNERLAPIARELGGEKHIARWLKWAKPDPDTSERIMLGLKSLRDRGALIWVGKGQPCTPGALEPLIEGQPTSNYAESEYWRITSPTNKPDSLARLRA